MLKGLLIVLGVVVLGVAVFLIYAATKPDIFHVERTARIKAAPEKIFAHINDLRAWDQWSPYLRDPAMSQVYSDPSAGVGATYKWAGNSQVGEGEVHIVETNAPSLVRIRLVMIKPFPADNDVRFTLTPDGEGTTVTWAMDGPSPYIAKVMGTIFSMDKMVGNDFEKGLANLKAVAERAN